MTLVFVMTQRLDNELEYLFSCNDCAKWTYFLNFLLLYYFSVVDVLSKHLKLNQKFARFVNFKTFFFTYDEKCSDKGQTPTIGFSAPG